MTNRGKGVTVIDLFCGGGGLSQGFYMAGFDVVFGIDYWQPACDTHERNGLGETKRLDLIDFDVDKVLDIKSEIEDKYGTIDVVIGSPPCNEFSMANKAGHGNLKMGMSLVRQYLLFVTIFRPKYWLMENVPRLGEILPNECDEAEDGGWRMPYEKIGIPKERWLELGLEGASLHIPHGHEFVASDYGTCENRKRFISGDLPIELMGDMKTHGDVSIGKLLSRLKDNLEAAGQNGDLEDPNYSGHLIKRKNLRDSDYDTGIHPMYWEEMRHLKRRHIQYGRMSLPENLTVPARTIMAVSNSSSRESLLFETNEKTLYQDKERKVYRQPTVREIACIQGFPIDFQLVASRINERHKLIGNAVPCQLSYALAKCIANDMEGNLERLADKDYSSRVRETLRRRREHPEGPILRVCPDGDVVQEADDIHEIHTGFKARTTKNIRRKLLSSKKESDSSVVIFENGALVDGKVRGGIEWKVCIQRGIGKVYHQVFFDEVSVPKIIKALDVQFDRQDIRDSLEELIKSTNDGIPLLTEGWVEYPGLKGDIKGFLSFITEQRLNLPSVSLLQKTFTEDLPDIGNTVGAIDLFDGLDAITLSTFSRRGRQVNRMIAITSLKDNDWYLHRLDPKIVPTIDNAEVPLVTLLTGFMCVHVLRMMYDRDLEAAGLPYYKSVTKADEHILRWIDGGVQSN
jgi:site-specific DNA-cytosine methylase